MCALHTESVHENSPGEETNNRKPATGSSPDSQWQVHLGRSLFGNHPIAGLISTLMLMIPIRGIYLHSIGAGEPTYHILRGNASLSNVFRRSSFRDGMLSQCMKRGTGSSRDCLGRSERGYPCN